MRYVGQSNSQGQREEWWLPGAGERGNGGSLMGIEFQFHTVKKVLEKDDGNSCIKL